MVPPGHEQGVADAIARDVDKQGLRTGVYGARYLLEILSDYGHANLAYRVATRTDEREEIADPVSSEDAAEVVEKAASETHG